MNQTDPTADFDGCRRACRQQGAHTLVRGECEQAPEPEPTVSLSRVSTAADGFPSIAFDRYTVPQLAELIEPALRRVAVRLGPNALGMLERGEPVRLSGGEYADLAREAAHAIVHRNAEPAVSAVVSPPTSRTELRDRIAEAMREHYLSTNRDEADADRNMPCRCGEWREPGAEVDDENDWDAHLADVALAVLPEPTGQAAEFELRGTTDIRAAVLLDAADTVEAMNEGCGRRKPCASCDARGDAADCLRDSARRLAAEAQQQPGADVVEAHRLALSEALHLGNGAPWDAILDRARDLSRRDVEARPARGDQFEQWLKTQRDEHRDTGRGVWTTLDNLLDLYRLHADTGRPLSEHVCEGRVIGDCECLEQPTAGEA